MTQLLAVFLLVYQKVKVDIGLLENRPYLVYFTLISSSHFILSSVQIFPNNIYGHFRKVMLVDGGEGLCI